MSTSPYLSAVRLSQRTGSNAVDGNGINAALSSSNTSATGTSSNLGQYESLASPSHRSSRRRLNCPYDSARMGGRQCTSAISPAIRARATPKSTCMLPAAHSSRTYPSRSGMPRFASRHRCT